MKYEFSPGAKNEFEDAADYYESQQQGLGKEFIEEVYGSIQRILMYPRGWHRLDEVFYRCLVRRFPYGIIYSIEDEVLTITAIMNLHRKPDYWKH